MRRVSAVLALAVSSLTTAGAQAAPLTPLVPLKGLTDGPALGPDAVTYATSGTNARALTVLRRPLAGGAAATLLAQAEPQVGDDLYSTGVEVSGGRVALGVTESEAVDPDGFTDYAVVRSGAGLKDVVAGTLGRTGKDLVLRFDLDGDQLVSVSDFQATLRDLAAPGSAPRVVGREKGVRVARVAGPFVAVGAVGEKAATVVVYDRATLTERSRTTVAITPPYAFGFDFDLQDDGTVAVLQANPASTGSTPKEDLAFAALGETTPRVVVSDVDPLVLRLAGGRALVSRARGPRSRELVLAGTDGTVTPVSFPTDRVAGADFDGTRVALATDRCLYVGDTTDAAVSGSGAEPPLGTCPQAAVRVDTPLRAPAADGVTTTVTCGQGPAAGCPVTVRLIAERVRGRGPYQLVATTLTLPVGTARTLVLKPSKTGLRKLRAALAHGVKTASVRIEAAVRDAAGLTARDARTIRLWAR